MSLCRFYPAPSDRMAIIWSLMPVKNAIVLEYGPAGTTHFGGGLYSSFGIELGKTLYTTHISEDDVIMGDVSRLENAIREVDAAYNPEIIFVVASAVIAVIGTDIAGVCRYMQDEVNARLISFEEGGFRGDYTYGLKSVYRMLAKEVVKPTDEKEKVFNILGASLGAWRMRSDVWEIQQLMKEAFGWDCHFTMGMECAVEDIETAGKASVNLVIRNEAVQAAEIMKDKCGTPYVYGVPYGYKGTLEWLKKISQVIGQEINPVVVKRLEEKIRRLMPMGGPMAMGLTREKPKAYLQADYDTLLGFKQAMTELDIDVAGMICSHSLKSIEAADTQIKHYPKEKDRINLFKSLKNRWCLGSEEMERYCGEANCFTLISAPFVSRSQTATHLPFVGEKGMDRLVELKNELNKKINI